MEAVSVRVSSSLCASCGLAVSALELRLFEARLVPLVDGSLGCEHLLCQLVAEQAVPVSVPPAMRSTHAFARCVPSLVVVQTVERSVRDRRAKVQRHRRASRKAQ